MLRADTICSDRAEASMSRMVLVQTDGIVRFFEKDIMELLYRVQSHLFNALL